LGTHLPGQNERGKDEQNAKKKYGLFGAFIGLVTMSTIALGAFVGSGTAARQAPPVKHRSTVDHGDGASRADADRSERLVDEQPDDVPVPVAAL
jgi:hypothetical protein